MKGFLSITRRRFLNATFLSLLFSAPAFATWSIVAVDRESGEIVVASATCLPQEVFVRMGVRGLREVQAVVVPGKGAGVAQASIETTRRNQRLMEEELARDTVPAKIIELIKEVDPAYESRQFGIVDLQGRGASFTGSRNQSAALSESGSVGRTIHYQIQGNILAREAVIHRASRAFGEAGGSLGDRAMAAMDAADSEGGDRRCSDGRTAMVAYFLKVDRSGRETYIYVTDEESANPVRTLRERYAKSGLEK
jgi:uncharacterized Ntn-hydrolase superfamily protein